ncbi:sensor histidine kinase, partial [Nocardioides massiliensis]
AVPDGDEVVFAVTDQGRGIPPERLEDIFERFRQVDSSDARLQGGTGLGLAITRAIITQLGGRVWAESQVGVGSTFRFTLQSATHADAEELECDCEGSCEHAAN